MAATDAEGNRRTRTYALSIAEAPVIVISPENLPDGRVGAVYDTNLTASGATGPYNFTVTTGALPAGLTLSNGGKLSGTPVEDDTSTFTVTATDADGFSGAKQYTISVNPPHIAITPQTLVNGKVGKVYETLAFEASGGTEPYTFVVINGVLPVGLTLGLNGELSGTPGQAGSFTFTVRATDANSYHGSHGYTLVISAAPTIVISPESLPSGKVGLAYAEQTLSASGGTGPYSFAVTGLPAGLAFSNGKISGTPTA
ncbi:Ig domain-containing protein, partial [Brucella pituitosa]